MDLQSELGGILQEFSKNSISQPTAPEEGTPAPVVTPEVPATLMTPPEPTAVTPTEPVVPEPVAPIVDSVIDDWDADAKPTESVATPTPTAVFDFSEMGKALGTEDIKTKEDLISFVSKVKSEAESAKSGLSDLPQELTKAIELAKTGGDYLSYLKVSSVDYGKLDPVDVYEEYVIDRSTDENGNVDYDKVNTFLDSIQDFDKELRGKEIIKNLQSQQLHAVKQLEDQASKRKEQAISSVQTVLSTLDDVNGFKLKPTHKQELFDWIVSGKMMKEAFFSDKTGEYDFSKVVKAAALLKYGEKMDAYRKQQIRNSVKRELLDDLQNPQVEKPTIAAGAEPKRGYDLGDFVDELKNKTRN